MRIGLATESTWPSKRSAALGLLVGRGFRARYPEPSSLYVWVSADKQWLWRGFKGPEVPVGWPLSDKPVFRPQTPDRDRLPPGISFGEN